MNRKAFTLIELLVVVAIIGILAAVGVVAYNGYTSAAKKKTTEVNHKIIVKYISTEVMKCNLGESSIMSLNGVNQFNCSNLNPINLSPLLVAAKKVLDNTVKNSFQTSKQFQKAYPNSAIGFGSMYKCLPEGETNYYTQAQGLHSFATGGVGQIKIFTCSESSGTPKTTHISVE